MAYRAGFLGYGRTPRGPKLLPRRQLVMPHRRVEPLRRLVVPFARRDRSAICRVVAQRVAGTLITRVRVPLQKLT